MGGILREAPRRLQALTVQVLVPGMGKGNLPRNALHPHKAGDKLFIDFTGKKAQHNVDRHTGEIQDLEVYLCVLGSSQYTYVEACASQKLEDFMRCTENALWFYGGVPRALVTDNLKSAVTKSSRYEPKVNETFADFAEHYETAVLPTRAYRPRDKAIVENAVRIIYTRVFAPLRNQYLPFQYRRDQQGHFGTAGHPQRPSPSGEGSIQDIRCSWKSSGTNWGRCP